VTYVPQNKRNLVAAAAAAAASAPAAPSPAARLRGRFRRVTGRTLALAAIATALPVGVGATVVVLVRETPPREPTRTAPLGAGPDGRVTDRPPLPGSSASLAAAFARLREDATAEDRDNSAIRTWARNATPFGVDPDAARVLAHIDGKRLWLVPGNGFACLAVQAAGGSSQVSATCDTEAMALRDGLHFIDGDMVYGILPDGVERIEVTDDDGFRHVEPVHRNGFILRAVSATVRYRIRGGPVEMFRVIGRQPSP
jgi:hypothetical protein